MVFEEQVSAYRTNHDPEFQRRLKGYNNALKLQQGVQIAQVKKLVRKFPFKPRRSRVLLYSGSLQLRSQVRCL